MRQALVLYRQDNGSYGQVGFGNTGFNDVVTVLYGGGYLTNNAVVDPKTVDNYLAWCSGGGNPDCIKVRLRATLESDGSTYDVYTP